MRIQRFPLIATTIATAAILSLGACDRRQEDRTAGQKADTAIAKVEQKTEQAAAEVKKGVNAAGESAGKAMSDVGSKVKDAAITTGVNAELARDASLSALKINVDTSDGRVSLRGTAPDSASRERATQLAQRVDGVVSVENDLQIRKN